MPQAFGYLFLDTLSAIFIYKCFEKNFEFTTLCVVQSEIINKIRTKRGEKMDVRNIALHPKTFQRMFLRHMTSLTLKNIDEFEK